MNIMKIFLFTLITLALSACGGDKSADSAAATDAPMAETMAMDDEYGRVIDHAMDAAEFELRRSIGGLERIIEQYNTDGHATEELEAQKGDLSASLDALLGGA